MGLREIKNVAAGCPQLLDYNSIRRPVSRVLSRVLRPMGDHSSGTILADRLARPTRMEHEGVPALADVHPYSVLLQAGLTLPSLSPGTRWALTPPFHPYPGQVPGGLLSVALSLGLRFLSVASPGGRYPPPCLRGARTFLQQVTLPAIAQPPDRAGSIAETDGKSDSTRF